MFEINLNTQIYRPSKVILATARTKRILFHTLLILNNVRILKETSKGKKLFISREQQRHISIYDRQGSHDQVIKCMTGKLLLTDVVTTRLQNGQKS